jgi:protein gp37
VTFVNSMSDLCHAKVPLGFIEDVSAVIRDTPQQVLTQAWASRSKTPLASPARTTWEAHATEVDPRRR